MTTDFIQHKHTLKEPKFMGLNFTSIREVKIKDAPEKGQLELTRDDRFVEGTQDIFDILAEHAPKKNNAKTRITTALLTKAKNTIEKIEKEIIRQAARINTLERISTIDELTGLQNQQGFKTSFERELSRTKRHPDNAGILVLIEIESYDSIKEKHGKTAADTSLKLVSRMLSDEVRAMDIAARLSENEFVLLFTNTAADKVLDRTQQLALRLNNISMIWDKQEIRMNASLGLRGYGPQDKFEALFKSDNKGHSKQ